uniref:C-type lectin domain-containing protein n=1 Tax=Catharus ustulatus TaxID=91951 RepID=A0A8C3V3E8_CATUS
MARPHSAAGSQPAPAAAAAGGRRGPGRLLLPLSSNVSPPLATIGASIPFPLAPPGQSPPTARYSDPTVPHKSHAPGRAPCPCLSSPALSPDWQVSRSLQDASRQHTTEQGRLSQALRSQEQSREQTQLELSRARGELQRLWHEYNITQMELEKRNSELKRRNSELGHTLEELAVLQEEMQVVQGRLNTSESTVSSLRACVNTDCCPAGWVLYKSKCLYISVTKKTWQQSWENCENQSADLLVQDKWPPLTVPHFVHESNATYWIGRRFSYGHWRPVRTDGKYHWKYYNSECWSVVNWEMWSLSCDNTFRWICEKSPDLSSASETRPPFLAKD